MKLAITSGWIGPGARPILISFASPTRPIIPEPLGGVNKKRIYLLKEVRK